MQVPCASFEKVFHTFFILYTEKFVTLSFMEGELYNTIQKQELQGIPPTAPPPKFPDISFGPPVENTSSRGGISPHRREVCAKAGIVIGGIAIISWFIIALGIIFAIFGTLFSYLGLTSSRAKYARIGLYLSIAGGVLSLLYVFVVYAGFMNYNFFTNELWGIPSGGVQTFE